MKSFSKILICGFFGLITFLAVTTDDKKKSKKNGEQDEPAVDLVNAPVSNLRPTGELQQLYSMGGIHTNLQRDEKTEEIKGKIVEWTLNFYDVHKMGDNKYRVTTQADDEVSTSIVLTTRTAEEKDRMKSLTTGNSISIRGKIDDVTFRVIEIEPAILQ